MEENRTVNQSSLEERLSRSTLLLGEGRMDRLRSAKVIVLGIGGVGSWCCEALIRTGLEHLTVVDDDQVAPSNINRQLMATCRTLGMDKVTALREHLLEVSPGAQIRALKARISLDSLESFHLEDYDYVIDAIDSIRDKAALILHVTGLEKVRLFSSMGAALRMDPTKIRTGEFRKVEQDALAVQLRRRFKQAGQWPGKFQCVYSIEPPQPRPSSRSLEEPAQEVTMARPPMGSILPVTGCFGFMLASMVLMDLESGGVQP